MNSSGDVIDVVEEKEQVPGNTVVLTLDSQLQKVAQDSLASNIRRLQDTKEERKGKEASAGAVAVIQCKTGEALALATYPSYDLSAYQRDYDQIAAGRTSPSSTARSTRPTPPAPPSSRRLRSARLRRGRSPRAPSTTAPTSTTGLRRNTPPTANPPTATSTW